MKIQYGVISGGVIVLVLGIIFYFQGNAIIGPKSSFMYSNPDWITYGFGIAITGMIILGIGVSLRFLKKSNC